MGRYYNGDIEGKFWFGVQSSEDASFFGGSTESNHIDYSFDDDDLETIREGIAQCNEELGDNKAKLDKFFEENNSYNNEMLVKELEVSDEEVRNLLEWYARLRLGEKILKCVEENEYCDFEAEL